MMRCSASVIRGYRSKPQWDTAWRSLGWLLSKNTHTHTQKPGNVGEDVEKLNPSSTAGMHGGAGASENHTQHWHSMRRIQPAHFRACAQRTDGEDSKDTSALPRHLRRHRPQQPKGGNDSCPTTDEWINKAWYGHTHAHTRAMEYHPTSKSRTVLTRASIRMNSEDVTLGEISQSQKDR